MNKMRPAVALLITLAVIASMLALMGVMFGYLGEAKHQAEIKSSVLQANLLRDDIGTLLKQILGKKPSKSRMQLLYKTPLAVSAKNGEFSMAISCKPIANRVNMLWIGMGNKAKYQKKAALAQNLFEMLTGSVNLRDPELLKDKIIAAIRHKNSTKFGQPRRLNEKKGIITFERFKQILDDYRFEVDDPNVYKITWDRYFTFGIPDGGLDGDFVTPELLAFLYDVDINVVKENLKEGDLDGSLEEMGGFSKARYKWLFAKNVVAKAECSVTYSFKSGGYNFKFDYLDGRTGNFEFSDK